MSPINSCEGYLSLMSQMTFPNTITLQKNSFLLYTFIPSPPPPLSPTKKSCWNSIYILKIFHWRWVWHPHPTCKWQWRKYINPYKTKPTSSSFIPSLYPSIALLDIYHLCSRACWIRHVFVDFGHVHDIQRNIIKENVIQQQRKNLLNILNNST